MILDPEVIEVVGVSIEFESFFLVFPIRSELIQVRRGITRPAPRIILRVYIPTNTNNCNYLYTS